MNNKLFARIMTAVICICMMSTVVFAAPALEAGTDETTKVINFMDGETNWIAPEEAADMVTMMAYLVPAGTPIASAAYVDETNTPMIAIDQYDGDALATTVSVLASKLVEGKDIVLQKGDSNGNGAKIVVAKEEIGGETVITVINGAASIEVTADADGNVTLPTDTAWNGGTPVAGATFTLYSWVTADGATEHLAGAKVAAADLEGKTLYAKFDTGLLVGDVDLADGVDSTDSSYINFLAFYGENYLPDTLNQPIFEGSSILVGDVDLADGVDSTDSSYIDFLAFYGENYLPDTLGAKIYLVNKAEVEAIYTVTQ